MNDWYRDSFGKDYLDVYAHRDAAQGRTEAASIVNLLQLQAGQRLLDVACGSGRHSFALEKTGVAVTGIDLSADLLRAGRATIQNDNNHLLVRSDMRLLPFLSGAFDAAVSLFTSFGYFIDEAEDRSVLAEIHRVLTPGGRFLLDFLNAERVVRELVPRSEETRGDLHIIQERRITPDGRRVEKSIRVDSSDPAIPTRNFLESVRLYDRAQLEGLFAEVGFRVDRAVGSFDGEPAGPDSPRLILVGGRDS